MDGLVEQDAVEKGLSVEFEGWYAAMCFSEAYHLGIVAQAGRPSDELCAYTSLGIGDAILTELVEDGLLRLGP